jgi:hypothetical protein
MFGILRFRTWISVSVAGLLFVSALVSGTVTAIAQAASPSASTNAMTLNLTVELANGRPAPKGATIFAVALPSASSSAHAVAAPPRCSQPTLLVDSRAELVIDGSCATQYADETGNVGVLGFQVDFINDHGQPMGGGSTSRVSFAPSARPVSEVIKFNVDPAEIGVSAGATPPLQGSGVLSPIAPNTGNAGQSVGSDMGRLWPVLLGLAALAVGAALGIVRRSRVSG